FRNQRWIVLRVKFTERVVVGKGLRKRNWHQVQARVCWDSGKEIDRLSDHADQRGNLIRSELLQCTLLVDENRLDLHAEPLEHDRAGQTRPASRRPEVNFLAAQILD